MTTKRSTAKGSQKKTKEGVRWEKNRRKEKENKDQ